MQGEGLGCNDTAVATSALLLPTSPILQAKEGAAALHSMAFNGRRCKRETPTHTLLSPPPPIQREPAASSSATPKQQQERQARIHRCMYLAVCGGICSASNRPCTYVGAPMRCSVEPLNPPEQELAVQVGHVDGVHVNHIDVAKPAQRQVLQFQLGLRWKHSRRSRAGACTAAAQH